MVPPSSHEVSRASRYSGSCPAVPCFTYVALTPFGSPSHAIRLHVTVLLSVLNPGIISDAGLASAAFARRYLRYLG